MATPKAATKEQIILIVTGTLLFFLAASRSDIWGPTFISGVQKVGTAAKLDMSNFGVNNKVEVHYPTMRQRCLYKAQVAEVGFFDLMGPAGKVTPAEFEAAHPELCNE